METKNGKATQEVRVHLDLSVYLSADNNAKDIKNIVMRGVHNVFPNNKIIVNQLALAEEIDICFEHAPAWRNITDLYKVTHREASEVA